MVIIVRKYISFFKKYIKEHKWLAITMLVSSLVISLIYIIESIAPFGDNSMLDVDFYHQYGPLLNELYDRIKSGESLLYSFNTGGGLPFYRNLLNYLSSPFNAILLLFKKENIIMAFSIVIALKCVAAATTFSYYLKRTFKKEGPLLVIFSLFYAFSGYFCAYYWNIMWLDGIVFLPLVMHGINKIIKEEKPVFYIISLAVMLLSNYFIGYMVCIFSVFYFLGLFIYNGNFKLKNIARKFLIFGFSSLLAGGLVAFALIPLYSSLSSISATKDAFPSLGTKFGILDYLFNHIPAVNRTVFASDTLPLPNVYTSVITFAAIILFFANKKINYKAKILISLSLLFFFSSFNIDVLDYIWHAFHFPNDLPWRYSFIYVFVLCVIGYYSLINIETKKYFKVSVAVILTVIFVLLASKFDFDNLDKERIIVCLIMLVVYYLIYLFSNIKKIPKMVISVILILIASLEMIYSITFNWEINHDIEIFMEDKVPYKKLINKAKESDNNLYRIEKTSCKTLNDGAWYDYNGMTIFSSMAYEKTAKFQRMFGLSGNNINSYCYKDGATPVYNAIFNIRYIMGDIIDNNYYNLMDIENSYNLYRFDYPTSIAYAVDNEMKTLEMISDNPIINQSNFVVQSTGYNDIYEPINVVSVFGGAITNEEFFVNSNGVFEYVLDEDGKDITFTLKNDKSQNIYIYVGAYGIDSYEVNGKFYSISSDEYYIQDIGIHDKGLIDVKINFKEKQQFGTIDFYAYSINNDIFKKFYNKISNGMLKIDKYNNTYIEGTINVDENQFVFTTLSYDKGFKVYVDEKKVDTKEVLDAYLSFEAPTGKHKIKIVYFPQNQTIGNVISIVSLVFLSGYIVFKKRNKKKS